MSATIDSRAIVSPKAQLGENVVVGPFSIIEEDVFVGAGTHIASNVLIANGSRIGKECHIHHGAVLASTPQDLKFHGEVTTLEIGDHTTVREYATLNRGTHARGKTTVGNHCFIMAYAHVAHDCSVGNHVILANAVNMAGHVVIEDSVVVGGIVAIHQFTRIGRHAMIGGGFRATKDVPPYVLAGQEPLAFTGLNMVGLKRRNFPQDVMDLLEKVYQLIYNSDLNISQALERIKKEIAMTEEVRHVIDFIEKSKRGIIWRRR
ncbi:MAG TPA: acyl-ACP--UDP-N-acetylglucosamine O-acyltransferase [Bacteroidota bacterium]|jgi:UDP-N-acetylglucosamine acyltransferase|nr:acyl-ACP--UDP-N-acetylglucosamine O-acyltransferase [Bacteroidota bacterium]